MNRTLLLIALFVCVMTGSAFGRSGQVSERVKALKDRGVNFERVAILDAVPPSMASNALWDKALTKALVLEPRITAMVGLVQQAPRYIALELPSDGGLVVLDLIRTEITTDDFKVTTASGAGVEYRAGAHYRGMVRGRPGSVASISIFDGELMGLFNDTEQEWVLGRLDGGDGKKHVLYRSSDLFGRNPFVCGTVDEGEPYRSEQLTPQGGDRTTRCVRYYWEVNYNIFQDKGDIPNTTNYITGLFNQSAVLFDNDGIDVTLSEMFIWDVASPYAGPGSGDFLTQFGVERTSFNGDMAHLLGYGGGGGVAWLNTLCNGQTRLRMAYSGINSSYSNVPTYSWSVEVVTHEQGHNLGSKHTHACAWNGDATSIDGCGPTAGYSEGSCPVGPIPSSTVKGTIMSYCHLVSGVGINFNNGFGPQPTAVIVNAVNAASCLSVCGTSCDAPGNLTALSITTSSATLSWSAIGAVSYTLQWRLASGGSWTTITGITGNTYALSGLTQGTAYEFQVLAVCSTGSSPYSSVRTFSTLVPCPDSLEPNNSTGAAANITLPATISALIATTSDVDYYRFTLAATSDISISMYNLPGDFDVRLLDNAGAQLAISQAGGTTSEYISYLNAAAGTYYVHVFGYAGVFSADRCYSLYVSASTSLRCDPPDGLSVTGITWSEGSVSWPMVQGASAYDLRWKESAASTWVEVNGLTGTSHSLTGLNSDTDHDVQVRSVCQGAQGGTSSSTSAYTSTTVFRTLPVPCEVTPPVLVSIRVMLDGPYNGTLGLMSDELRSQGLVPLNEPYSAMGHVLAAAASTTAPVLAVTGSNAIVDWVLVELRDATSPGTIVEARAALVQCDGDVVGTDGTSALGFCSSAGNYSVVVRHRNHLGVATAGVWTLGPSATVIDLTSGGTATYGTNARRNVAGTMTLWAGNSNSNGEVKYAGSGNDRDVVLSAIGGSVATNTVAGYRAEDCNLDGLVKYAGSVNDRDVILQSIGGSVSTSVVTEQLP